MCTAIRTGREVTSLLPAGADVVPGHPSNEKGSPVTATADLASELVLDHAAQDLLFRATRTAYAFTDEPVTDAQLAAVHDLVSWAPTSMNTQPLRVVALRSQEARDRLLPSVAEGNQAKVRAAPLVLVLAADTRFHTLMERTFPVAGGVGDMFAADDDLREHTARFNAALQIAYLIMGLRSAGLGAAPMAGFDPAGVDAAFFADSTLSTQLIMGVGRVAGPPPFGRLPRLAFDEVFSEL
jgi:3-hydroxypropanoate dehydrogenase